MIRWTQRKPLLATTIALVTFLAIAGPLAALLINQQRSRLASLIYEKNNLIEGMSDEKQQDAGQIAELREQLDLWEGRGNPWEYWPPKQGSPPRRKVIEELFRHASQTLADRHSNGNYDDEDRSRGALSLAIMADAMGSATKAVDFYQEARDGLETLLQRSPQRTELALAKAECNAALARLTSDRDRTTAEEHLVEAQRAYQRLANNQDDEIRYEVELLESKLNSATLAGFESGKANLEQVAEIYRSLPKRLPSHPDSIYRLACFLAQREPVLVENAGTTPSP